MHSLQKQFHDFVQAEELLHEDDHVLLAVSGGLDSMVMADIFLKAGWNFAVAHCNFNLRGEESDGDEEFVRSWAKEHGIALHAKRFDLGGGSVQLKARNARYEWFEKLSSEEGFNKIATAHHLNDSLETVLINLSRGTGVRGFSGIRSKNDKIVRPLLFASKDQLRDYANECSLKWREDSSNLKNDYDRNLLRLEVIPKLEELNPSLINTFRSTSERLHLASELVSSKVAEIKAKYLSVKGATSELKLEWVQTETDLLILSEILAGYGFSYFVSKQVFEALGRSGKQFFANDHVLTIDRDSLFIKQNEATDNDFLQIEGTGVFQFQQFLLTISLVDKDDVDFSENESTAFLDASLATFPMKLRRWEEGDRFTPLGMKGTKKVSDYLVDKKVPLALKNKVLVLQSEDQIVWLAAHQISEKFKIGEKTEKVLRITFAQGI